MNLALALMLLATADQAYHMRTKLHPLRTASTAPAPEPSDTPGKWEEGDWSSYSSQCSDSAVRTRVVHCVADGSIVADDRCSAPKPEASQTTGIYSGCTDMVINGTFDQGANGWSGSGYTLISRNANPLIHFSGSGSITRETLPLEAGVSYTLSFGCEQTSNSGNFCNVYGEMTVGGVKHSYYKNSYGSYNSPRPYVTVVGDGSPATVTITATRALYVDKVSVKRN